MRHHIILISSLLASINGLSASFCLDTDSILPKASDADIDGFIANITSNIKYESRRLSPDLTFRGGIAKGRFHATFVMGYFGEAINKEYVTHYKYSDIGLSITDKSIAHGWGDFPTTSINASYDFNKKSKISLGFSADTSEEHKKTRSYTSTSSDVSTSGDPDMAIHYDIPIGRPNYGLHGIYELTFENGGLFTIDADFSSTTDGRTYEYKTDTSSILQEIDGKSWGVHINPQTTIVMNRKHKISLGYDLFDSHVNYLDNNSDLCYTETINSGLAKWDADWSDALATYVGMRVEDLRADGVYNDFSPSFGLRRTDVLPFIGININIPEQNQQISVAVERNTRRPSYASLNPYTINTSNVSCTRGNPELKPEYTWNASIDYTLSNHLCATAFFHRTTDCITCYTLGCDGISTTDWLNNGERNSIGASLKTENTFCRCCTLACGSSLERINRKSNIDGIDLGFNTWLWSLTLDSSIDLSQRHGWAFNLKYNLSSPARDVTMIGRWANIASCAVTKNFSNKLTLSLSANNILNYKDNIHFSNRGYSYSTRTRYSSASVNLSVSYTFGKIGVKGADDVTGTVLQSRLM